MQSSVYRGVEGAGKKFPLELPADLGPKDILLKITHASLCGTDVHFLASGMALGHEGVGVASRKQQVARACVLLESVPVHS